MGRHIGEPSHQKFRRKEIELDSSLCKKKTNIHLHVVLVPNSDTKAFLILSFGTTLKGAKMKTEPVSKLSPGLGEKLTQRSLTVLGILSAMGAHGKGGLPQEVPENCTEDGRLVWEPRENVG